MEEGRRCVRTWSYRGGLKCELQLTCGLILSQDVQVWSPSIIGPLLVIGCWLLSGIGVFKLPGKGTYHWSKKTVWTIPWAPVSDG